MRGRYLSLQLTVDGCSSTLPSAKDAEFQRNINGVPSGKAFRNPFRRHNLVPGKARRQRQQADRDSRSRIRHIITNTDGRRESGASCEQMRLSQPVDFYIAEHATDPTRLQHGQELWIEVTVPPKGPPRPLQLALKDNGAWKPLAFQ